MRVGDDLLTSVASDPISAVDIVSSLGCGVRCCTTLLTISSFTVEILAAKRNLSRSFLTVLGNSECRERTANPSLLQSGGSPATFDP
jgi:hypothetical protein